MSKLTEVAEHLDLSTTRIHGLVKAGILPKAGRAAYDLAVCRVSYIRYIREIAAGRGSKDGAVDLVAERARLTRAQAEHAERKNAVEAGEFLPRGEVHFMVTSAFARVRAKLLALPAKLAPLVVGAKSAAEAQKTLRDTVYQALNELAATTVTGVSDDGEVIYTETGD